MAEQSTVRSDRQQQDLLRLLTCGSVDDGKSTLIGRLLYDTQKVPEDQLTSLEAESKKFGTVPEGLDFALLLDGLQAEREQGITIDVAYRYFSSARRTFILADTPGHEQYTRNMVTAASISDLAVLLVDAAKGISIQTRRHSSVVHLVGIKHVVLAVNKMDLVDFRQDRFDALVEVYRDFCTRLGIVNLTCVPVSARDGDNVVEPSARMAWYRGPTLMAFLETVEIAPHATDQPFRMPVQWVARPDADFRGFAGGVAAGVVRPGDPVAILPSGRTSRVKKLATQDGDAGVARIGDAITIVLEDEVDVSRGDVIAAINARPHFADQVSAHLIWFADEPMLPGRPYLIRLGTQTATATITQLKHKISVDSLDHIAGRQLDMNEIGNCNLSFSRPLVFEPYETSSGLGGFILIDKMSNDTIAAGLIRFGAASGHQHSLAEPGCRSRDTLRHQGTQAVLPVVHGSIRVRQVDHRQFAGKEASVPRASHLPLGRRQRAAWVKSRSRVHGCRSGRKYSAGGGSCQVDGGSGIDRAGVVHFAVPRRTTDGARTVQPGRISRNLRRHAAGRVRAPRSQGPLPQGTPRLDYEFHRDRFCLRASLGARAVACNHGGYHRNSS